MNKTEKTISRIGRAIGAIAPVLYQFDKENNVIRQLGAHHIASSKKDRNIIVSELVHAKVFSAVLSRKHSTFPKLRHILHAKSEDELVTWMMNRLYTHDEQ